MGHDAQLHAQSADLHDLVQQSRRQHLAAIPYGGWVLIFAALFTALNLQGIRASARTNEGLVIAMSIVIFAFSSRRSATFSPTAPTGCSRSTIPATFSMTALSKGTSLAVLTYIGFDGSRRSPKRPRIRAQYPAGHHLHLLFDRRAGDAPSLSGPARLARLHYYPTPTPLRPRGRPRRRPILFQALNFTLLVASLDPASARNCRARACSTAWGATA